MHLFYRYDTEAHTSALALFSVPVEVLDDTEATERGAELSEPLGLFTKQGDEGLQVFARADDSGMTFLASEPVADRAQDIVAPPWRLANFRRNPVFLFGHDMRTPPVGRVTAKVTDRKLVASVKFDESPLNPLGQLVAHQFRAGFLSAVSVGFRSGKITHRSKLADEDEFAGDRGYVLQQNELLELSAVTVPMLPSALAQRGLETEHVKSLDELRWLATKQAGVPMIQGDTDDDLDAVLTRAPGPEVADLVIERMRDDAAYRDTVRRLLGLIEEEPEGLLMFGGKR